MNAFEELNRRVQEATAADAVKLERVILAAFKNDKILDWMYLRLMRELHEKK